MGDKSETMRLTMTANEVQHLIDLIVSLTDLPDYDLTEELSQLHLKLSIAQLRSRLK